MNTPGRPGRPLSGDKPLTAAERQRKSRERKKEKLDLVIEDLERIAAALNLATPEAVEFAQEQIAETIKRLQP